MLNKYAILLKSMDDVFFISLFIQCIFIEGLNFSWYHIEY